MVENQNQANVNNEDEFLEPESGVVKDTENDSDNTQSENLDLTAENRDCEQSVESLKKKIVELEAVAADNWDKAVRAMSDLENIRRRAERDVSKAHKFAIENFVKSLLPVMDSLEQACEADIDDVKDSKEGLELTLKLFTDTLNKNGVEILEPKGEEFDPTLHEAMSTQKDLNSKPGTVLTVFQKGYQLSGRVIRPARVIVAAK
jgi:molecular chaperone GrpE